MHKAEPYATGSTKRFTMEARWIELSPDPASKDPTRIVPSGGIFGDHLGQLFHGEVVFSIAASDVQMGLIRAGTGDGKGWYTKGAGKNRKDVTKKRHRTAGLGSRVQDRGVAPLTLLLQ